MNFIHNTKTSDLFAIIRFFVIIRTLNSGKSKFYRPPEGTSIQVSVSPLSHFRHQFSRDERLQAGFGLLIGLNEHLQRNYK